MESTIQLQAKKEPRVTRKLPGMKGSNCASYQSHILDKINFRSEFKANLGTGMLSLATGFCITSVGTEEEEMSFYHISSG